MKFSVIMASFLGNYPGAAARRDEKLIRAVESVKDQTFKDWELIVVADGCQQTVDLMQPYLCDNVRCKLIKKRPMWDGEPRNMGIDLARGEYIIYLDNDDCWGENHLQGIADKLENYDWVFFNDWMYSGGEWVPRVCDIRKLGGNGTSNVCHRKSLGAKWGHRGYAHDHYFNQQLMIKSRNFAKIDAGEYYVCHIPGGYDV